MTEYGLVGERLGHSFSPEIHAKIADYKYELIEVPRDEIDGFFERKEFKGLNVTIPYKETVIPHLDAVDEAAGEIGAVNTVVNENGRLTGYNTDFVGMLSAMLRAGILPVGKKVLICGTGGTSKTAAYTAKQLGAKEAVFLSRTARNGAVTYEEAYKEHSDAGIIINATPCGMYPDNFSSPIDISRFPALSGVFDAVFNPLRTKLVVDARRRGIPACCGLYMLISQAIRASELFRGRTCSKGLAEAVYRALLLSKENVVLIGMPSSGKTTVGGAVASLLGRELADTDELIVKSEGESIPDIFAKNGEEYFRDAETRAIKELSKKQGAVIATGGGAVLREENVDALRQNGRLYFLDCPLEALEATRDRPLSGDRESLEKLYRERQDIYLAACDVRTERASSPEETAQTIVNEFTSGREI